MRYGETCPAVFLRRPNRFIAEVETEAEGPLTVHVKNTGRCRELLRPGCRVILAKAANPARKTPYDLIAAVREDGRLFNIDSQAPNAAAGEWLRRLGIFDEIRPEYAIGDSRFDFFLRRGEERYLLEIKGCTLVRGGIGYFPDAPTLRGARHLRELARLAGEGFHCSAGFVIQTEGVTEVLPNRETDPDFARALEEASKAGVAIRFLPCRVTEDSLSVCESAVW